MQKYFTYLFRFELGPYFAIWMPSCLVFTLNFNFIKVAKKEKYCTLSETSYCIANDVLHLPLKFPNIFVNTLVPYGNEEISKKKAFVTKDLLCPHLSLKIIGSVVITLQKQKGM